MELAKSAPDRLELVRAFINSVDIEENRESLATPDELVTWLREHGLLRGEVRSASDEDLETAIGLREAFRELALANNGESPGPIATVSELERCCDELHVRLRARLGGKPALSLEPDESGVRGALGRLLVIAFEAMLDGSWYRLKACAEKACRWAFYDQSRNRSAHWCSMRVCGNRNKVRRFRQREPIASA
jgi:predicted RNA-binding Zn ribbon-like protein